MAAELGDVAHGQLALLSGVLDEWITARQAHTVQVAQGQHAEARAQYTDDLARAT